MKIRNICSIQGTAMENEDALGNIENYFWIIDGATDLYDSKKSIGYSVSEITHLLSEKLKVYCNEKESLKTIFQNAIKEVRDIIGLNDSNHEEYYKLPTFAFIIARLSQRKLEYLILGDCVMLVNDEQLTDHRVDRLFDLGKNEIENSKKGLNVLNKKEILQKIRGLANTEKGYWIGSLDDSSIEHALYGNLEVTGDKIVLMSDGFYDYYSQNITKSFEELIVMRKESTELDPIYGKKDDASILVVEL